jgi:hypothetical protein
MAHQNPQPEPRLQHGWTDHEKALAAAGGHPYLPVSNDPRVLRAECREAASFT